LNHEVGDDAVEDGVVVVAAADEGGEIVAGLWGVGGVQLKSERTLEIGQYRVYNWRIWGRTIVVSSTIFVVMIACCCIKAYSR
jgi:hypothetical protein